LTSTPRHPAPDVPIETCDVLIIGGGPAGSTAATLLARRGKDVIMLEKEHHPRFHIGESLLPRNLAVLERLGMADEIAAMGVLKPGAEFVSDDTGESAAFPFAFSLDRSYTHAYQVRRSEFDAALFENARRKGARAMERMRVTDVAFEPGSRARVTAQDAGGKVRSFAPHFVLDGSGRDTFMASRLRTKQANKHNSTAAVFAHFRNVEARAGETAGYISIHLVENGWFWMIPLPDEVTSVGFVGNQAAFKNRRGPMAEFFAERLQASPTVRARMTDAERISEVYATGNYSYRAETAWGEGWMMIGDAFTFIDPVFSSGVLLAMTAGELGAGVACDWLESPEAGRAAARRAEAELRAMVDGISWLIYRINTPVLRSMFMSPRNTLRMRDGIITLLAGHLAMDWRSRLPLLALKSTFYILSLAHRLGWRIIQVPMAAAK
jgi:flavin-dependent dehydrogenase